MTAQISRARADARRKSCHRSGLVQAAHAADASRMGRRPARRGAADRGRATRRPAPRRFIAPVSRSGSRRAGRPIGAIRAIPEFRRASIFPHSRNVKSVTVRWPAPQRLTDESGTSIGYKHDLVFPLDVVAAGCREAGHARAHRPTTRLRKDLHPGRRQGGADASPASPARRTRALKQNEARVPVPANARRSGARSAFAP